MKTAHKIIFTFLISLACTNAFSQNNDDARALVQEGVKLNDAGKYAEAVDKYNQALKLDPEYIYADFELAYTLFASGKGNDGIPYLEKVIKANTNLTAGAYDLLGSIYDKALQTDKAVEAFKAGIAANPKYQRLYYNLGITYFRAKQYAEAEKCAIDAIKLDPKHASSQRMYALVCFHQNKRVNALLGFCSFILLEPNTARSTEAYNNIQHILQGGVLKDANGNATILVSTKDDKETGTLNTSISLAVVSGQSKKLTGMDLFEYELKAIFGITGELSQKKTEKTFFDKFFVDYFYKLSQSDNMAAFAHTVALTVNKEESAAWGREHGQQINAMAEWLQKTERVY